jgi:aspartate aminotransferase
MSVEPQTLHARASVPFLTWYESSRFAKRAGDPAIADLVFGNPHEMPIPAYVAALARHVQPQNKDWFAYKMSEPLATRTVAAALRARTGLEFSPDDIFMTNGGFAAIAASLRATVGPGDEVIFLSPPWFFYELLIQATGATPVRVRLSPPSFALDGAALAEAITPRTRAVIVNTPHNPSGHIMGPAELALLASVLRDASQRIGREIALLSDEAYWKITFDQQLAHSPAQYYPNTFVLYSYGKQLLAPGQRIGYIALPPTMPGRAALRETIMLAQCATGFAFPNALLQHALPDIDPLCVELAPLERRRDRVLAALAGLGYETVRPSGTFYVLVRSPLADDLAFVDRLADHDTYVLPGTLVELPGWFRISLTANDEMIERSLRAFEALRPQPQQRRALAPPADELALISNELVEATLVRSRDNPRRRVIQPFHKSESDTLHRMLNAVQPDSYVRPHRHLDPPKAEAFILLRGAVAFFTFDDDGKVRECLRLRAGSERFGVDLVPGVYHSFIALEPDTVIYEVKPGPYTQSTDKAFASFAPEEGSPGAPLYMASLLEELQRREQDSRG